MAPELRVRVGAEGQFLLQHVYQAGKTNTVLASTHLLDWAVLESKVSDANGRCEFEDGAAAQIPHRFYEVETWLDR